jgi:LmbE family N-acetylglucosaminyl deacetylase
LTVAQIPDLKQAQRVLCVQPHYDDNDIGAGGTIAALAAAGAEVWYLTATDDLVGVLDASLSDEEARRRLKAEQAQAGAEIGVSEQYWLDFPDAGPYDYFELRTGIIRHIRMLRPDFVFSVDPLLPYEMHRDHLVTGRATAEAVMLYGFPRLKTDPEIDSQYERHTVQGIVFYFTTRPNMIFDISETWEHKDRALGAYLSQFEPDGLAAMQRGMEYLERQWAKDEPFSHGEPLKVLSPRRLHGNLDPDAV